MTNTPDLDRLIEEHEVFRRNVAWMRQERQHYFGFRLMVAALAVLPLIACLGLAGAAVSPLIWKLTERVVPKPKWRDPFRRYKVM